MANLKIFRFWFTNHRMSRAYCVNLIISYYDSIIKQIDVYTEKLLKTIDPNDLVDGIGGFITDGDEPVLSGFEKYLVPVEPKYTPGVTRVVDYINSIRQEMIDRVNKCQQDTLDFYYNNRKNFEIDPYKMNAKRKQELKRRLLGTSFCFVLNTKSFEGISRGNFYINTCIFKLYLIVFDYYLDQDAIGYVRNSYHLEYFDILYDRLEKLFIESRILVYSSLFDYIMDCWIFQRGHQHLIEIRLDQILAKKDLRLRLHIATDKSHLIDLSSSKEFDFSSVVNLEIEQKVVSGIGILNSLGVFHNLTKLSLADIYIENDSAFENLANLRHLILILVEFVGIFEFDIHKRMPNLEEIYFGSIFFEPGAKLVGFHKLDLLSKLELNECNLYGHGFDLESFENSHVTQLKLKNMMHFPFAVLPNLRHLEIIECNFEPYHGKEFDFNFQVESKLETLIIHKCSGFSLSTHLVKHFPKLTKLTHLDLHESNVKPNKGDFRTLSSLKCLSLRDNDMKELTDGVFIGLDNLEELDLRGNKLNGTNLTQLDGHRKLKKVKLYPKGFFS